MFICTLFGEVDLIGQRWASRMCCGDHWRNRGTTNMSRCSLEDHLPITLAAREWVSPSGCRELHQSSVRDFFYHCPMVYIPIKPTTPWYRHQSVIQIRIYGCCWNKFMNSLGSGDQLPPLSFPPLPLSIESATPRTGKTPTKGRGITLSRGLELEREANAKIVGGRFAQLLSWDVRNTGEANVVTILRSTRSK